ncbi:hypothetical protein BCR44DRAFT_39632 [Catenaria anguillulae PL171]|uniref:SPX domain-containing protein n=1 Tax=Catenaria anguillulae PL171 TaxID=765915 RepID=A0A1Y2HGW5_9FUNG|nr:hypothetical protein BCR44DRAFT_39632 [Catenaria anguillulae PL171]
MTFSQHLHSSQVPEWSHAYLKYSLLKKRLIELKSLAPHPPSPTTLQSHRARAKRRLHSSSYGTFSSLLPIAKDPLVSAFEDHLDDFVSIFRNELLGISRFWHAALSAQSQALGSLEHRATSAPTQGSTAPALVWDLKHLTQTLTDLEHFRHVNRTGVIKILSRWMHLQPDLTTAALTHPTWTKLMDWMYDPTVEGLIHRADHLFVQLQPTLVVASVGYRDAWYRKTLSCPVDVPNVRKCMSIGDPAGLLSGRLCLRHCST